MESLDRIIYPHTILTVSSKTDYSKIYKRRLIVTSEAYTSKTCGVCGNVDKNLGSKKILKCHKCNIEIDRDYNGARNILLRVCSHIK